MMSALGESAGMSVVIDASPKLIYFAALSQLNTNQYEKTIAAITGKYETLLEDPAWFGKSIILLADVYYLKGDEVSAIAALQAVIESSDKIPEAITKEAEERLKSFQIKDQTSIDK